MKPAAKLFPPDIPGSLTPVDSLAPVERAINEGDDAQALRLTGVDFGPLAARRASFKGCAFEKCVFANMEVGRIEFQDCAFSGCDFAGAHLDGVSMLRVSFAVCRWVGAYLPDATLRHGTFEENQMAYANFGSAKLLNVHMKGCDLNHASFGYAQLKDVRWEGCRLSGAELFGVKLAGMDLRTDEIDGIVLGDRSELVGAVVTRMQALDLAYLLGVIVEESI